MLRVKQRLLGTEKWQFKSELTSADGTALSLVWGFVGVFFFCFISLLSLQRVQMGKSVVISDNVVNSDNSDAVDPSQGLG